MITRKDYMTDGSLHRQYYSQFITADMEQIITNHIGLDRLLACKERQLNDIPIHEWYALLYSMYDKHTGKKLSAKRASEEFGNFKLYDIVWHFDRSSIIHKMQEAGDYASLFSHICIFKECARQMIERHTGMPYDDYIKAMTVEAKTDAS